VPFYLFLVFPQHRNSSLTTKYACISASKTHDYAVWHMNFCCVHNISLLILAIERDGCDFLEVLPQLSAENSSGKDTNSLWSDESLNNCASCYRFAAVSVVAKVQKMG